MFKRSPSFSAKGKKFNVIILASGLGTRLRPETDHIPKSLVELDKEGMKSIDYLIQKFQYISERLIITTAYCGDLLEYYIRGKYASLNPIFSREEVSDLRGPGKSFVLGLDYALSELPTIVMFCDYIVEDYIPVDENALGISKKPEFPYVIDKYPKGMPVIEEGIIKDLIPNQNLEEERYGGFTGIAIFQDTLRLKSIAYTKAVEKNLDVAYDFDIVRNYIKEVKTVPIYVSKMYEFGTQEMLNLVRKKDDANNRNNNK
jgi:choline kinase